MNEFTIYKKRRLKREGSKYALSQREDKRFNKVKLHAKDTDHFDTNEVSKIEILCAINPEKAYNKLVAYLDNYPNDYYARSIYSGLLITLRRFNDAYDEIEDIERCLKIDKNMRKYPEKLEKNIAALAYSKLKYYLYTHNYQKAHDIIMSTHKLIELYSLEKTVFYIKNILNTPDKENYSGDSYMYRQIENYSYDEMKRHIRKHLACGNLDKDKPNTNIFVSDFPIDSVLEEIDKYLIDDNAVYHGLMEDDYYFKYDDCGKEENKFVNYFKVVCFHGTKNIITVLPVIHYNEMSYVNLNYMNPCSIEHCKTYKKKKDIF